MPIQFPLINGHRYDWSSAVIKLGGVLFNGITELTYRHALEPGELRGNRAQIIGRTRGSYSAEGSITLAKLEYADLIRQLGDGYMEKAFDITASYQPSSDSADVVTDFLRGCRITSAENSHSEGGDVLVVRCDLSIMWIAEAERTAVAKPIFVP